MSPKPFTFAAVAAGCIVAAGVGAYVATRQFSPEPAARPALVADGAAPTGVIESEGVVSPAPNALAPSSSPATGSQTAPTAAESAPVAARPERNEPAAPKPSVSRSDTARAEASRVRPTPRPSAGATPGRPEPASTTSTTQPAVEPAREQARADAEFPPMPSAPESRPAAREPERVFEDLVVAADSVIGLQIERTVTSEAARVEDRVEARVTRDVKSGNSVAIPAGSKMQGSVTLVDRGGKVRERARLGIRFHTLVLADGTQVPIRSETIYREGESPTGESSAKIGGAAVGGAILGAIIGGRKGAAVGGSIGAAGGTAAVMAGGRNPAEVRAGSTVTVRLSEPVTVTVNKDDRE